MRSLYCMCRGLVAMKHVDHSCWGNPSNESRTASISILAQRARPTTVAFINFLAHPPYSLKLYRRGNRKSRLYSVDTQPVQQWRQFPLSVPSSWTRPGDCSPSRKVVSKMIIFRFIFFPRPSLIYTQRIPQGHARKPR